MTHAYVKDIMTADVVAVRADAPGRNVAAMFRMHRVSGFPVVDDDGKVLGVVSETDLLANGAFDPAMGAHQVQHLEGVVAVRDLFTYPAPARAH